jgi:hypothetical protein
MAPAQLRKAEYSLKMLLRCPPASLPPCCRPDRDALVKSIHEVVEKANVVKEGWNGYNVIHDNASRVAALDIGFAPRLVFWMAWV